MSGHFVSSPPFSGVTLPLCLGMEFIQGVRCFDCQGPAGGPAVLGCLQRPDPIQLWSIFTA